MKALIINLDGQDERLAFQAGQLDRLGIGWERVVATTPATLMPAADDGFWLRWERPMNAAEKACLASHLGIWRRIATGDAPMLVLEDDAMLFPGVVKFLSQVAGLQGIDHISLETRGRKKLLGRLHTAAPMRRLFQDRSGAAAYVLWPSGADKLVARAERQAGLADAVICAAYLQSWQADPALAIQLDQCAPHGLAVPIAVKSSIPPTDRNARDGMDEVMWRRFRQRRFRHQWRMALRRIACIGRASSREVEIDTGV
ncbi:MAG: glycosyltransferase family 25 protein [Paracoccaceae bacterium]